MIVAAPAMLLAVAALVSFGLRIEPPRPPKRIDPGLALWQRGVTPAEQASYFTRAVTLMRTRYPYVEKAFWYKDAARPGEDAIQAGYGLLTTDLSPRPVYSALKALLSGPAR